MVKSQLIHGTANVNVYMAPSAQLFLPLGQCWGRCLQILSDQSSNGRVNCFPKKKKVGRNNFYHFILPGIIKGH